MQLTLIGNGVNYTLKKKFNWCFCVLLKYNFNLDFVKSMCTLIFFFFFWYQVKKKKKKKERKGKGLIYGQPLR